MFKVGQKVVCINDNCYSTSGIKPLQKGKIYEIKGVFSSFCGCIVVDVGIRQRGTNYCSEHDYYYYTGQDIWYFNPKRFASVEELSDTTIEEVLEQIYLGEPIGNHMP